MTKKNEEKEILELQRFSEENVGKDKIKMVYVQNIVESLDLFIRLPRDNDQAQSGVSPD